MEVAAHGPQKVRRFGEPPHVFCSQHTGLLQFLDALDAIKILGYPE